MPSPFLDLFNYSPELAYYSLPGQERFSPRQRRAFEGGYGDFYRGYLGALGGQIRAGELPSLSFYEYLGQNPFLDYYRRQRGPQNLSAFTPSVRWIV